MWRGIVPLTLLFLPVLAWAQFADLVSPNTLTLNPPTPEPGELVTVTLDDYAGGLFGADITWRVNGELVENTRNERSIEVLAGAGGANETVSATLALPGGGQETLQVNFTPAYLDIIIEPQTRVPDWYLGRSLPSIGSQVNATVVVSTGSIIDPRNHVYTWRLNNQVLEGGPLRGRNSMSFDAPQGDDMILSVSVADTAGNIIAAESKRIPSVDPSLTFYEQHPLYGSQAFPVANSFSLIGNSLTLKAEPFHLDSRVYNRPDVAEWEINQFATDNGSNNPYEITLQRAALFGNTNISFHVRSLEQVLQGDERNVRISF